jgi:predicted HicB family RNase H-like nuclease
LEKGKKKEKRKVKEREKESKKKAKRININLDPALHSRLKIEAIKRGMTLKNLIMERLRTPKAKKIIKKEPFQHPIAISK